MNYSLTDTDINNLLGGETKIIFYRDLKNYSSLEEVLEPYGNTVILYPARSESDGHWTALLRSVNKKGEPVVEFFDPYGNDPDYGFTKTDIKLPYYLALLMLASNEKLEYNNHKIQKLAKNVGTCGRHVVNRILYDFLPIDEYYKLFKSTPGVSADQLVVAMVPINDEEVIVYSSFFSTSIFFFENF